MPLTTKRVDSKWRVVELSGDIAKKSGIPVDGGGHESKTDAQSQAAAVNINQTKRGKKKRNMLA